MIYHILYNIYNTIYTNMSRTVLTRFPPSTEYSGDSRNKEESARLLGRLIASSQLLLKPYVEPILNALLRTHHATPNLHGHHGRPPVLTFHRADATANDGRIADMSTSLAMIIGTGRSTRLGRCAATGCDRVFYDATRNASQRYCELSCQNRAKAAAYRARQRHE